MTEEITRDANGAELQDGDNVTLIKDLKLGKSGVLKRGLMVKGIRLTHRPAEVDCKIKGTAIVLKAEFIKKV